MMMKKLKFWGLIFVSVMCVGLTACGGDDNGSPVQNPNDDTVTDPNAIMTFKDAHVAALCIQNFDKNNDSQLSYAEAAAVASIGNVFANTDITSFDELRYFKGLTGLSKGFQNCSQLTSITIPRNVNLLGTPNFYGCSQLSSLKVVSENRKYDSRDNCNLIIETATNTLIVGTIKSTIPNSVTRIGDSAYERSYLTSITIPNSVTNIGFYAFQYCNRLSSVIMPNGLTNIGGYAFYGCTSLTSVTIPNSVTSIGYNAFYNCSKLTSIESLIQDPTKCTLSSEAFPYASTTLYVPKGTIEKYKAAEGWKNFKNIVER